MLPRTPDYKAEVNMTGMSLTSRVCSYGNTNTNPSEILHGDADIHRDAHSKAPVLTRDFSRLWSSTYELHEDRQERTNLLS